MSHRTIRYALLLALEPIGTVRRVSELVAAVRPLAELGPRPSKFVSDLLRVELMRGRVTDRAGVVTSCSRYPALHAGAP